MPITAALALTAANERQIVNAFRVQHALTGGTARPLRELGLHDSRTLRQMVESTVVRRAGPERYFLDEGTWAGRRQLQGRTILRVVLALALTAVAAALYVYGR